MTKLEVINAMLGTLGELPLNELDARHPYVASGLRIIEQKNKSIQLNAGAGLWFNKLERYSLKPDTDGRVAVPEDLMQFTCTTYPNRYGAVRGFLWDNITDTDIIGEAVEVSAIRCLAFEDVPVACSDCISYEAMTAFSRDYEGDMQKIAALNADAQKAWVLLRAQNIREQRANTQRNPQVATAMAGFNRNSALPRAY